MRTAQAATVEEADTLVHDLESDLVAGHIRVLSVEHLFTPTVLCVDLLNPDSTIQKSYNLPRVS
ncbi:hypothetical protein KC727_02740 [Candidatus Kaiserbacteria bacterium]|nr:hypothetical protein [Candidatus Kaiserbacteria bacterium]